MNEFDNNIEVPGFTQEEVDEALEGLLSKGLIEKTKDWRYRLTVMGKAVRDLKSKQLNGEEVQFNWKNLRNSFEMWTHIKNVVII